MARRRRSRAKRQLTLLIAFLALIGLLELNRWLPGGWPGGGGESGFLAQPREEAATARLRPPEGVPAVWPRAGVTLALIGPGGSPPDEATVAADVAGAKEAPVDAQGRARLDDARVLTHGFVVRTPSAEHRHGPVDPTSTLPWTVHLMESEARRVEAEAERALVVEVLGAEDGLPVGGARIAIDGGAGDGGEVTDALTADEAGRLVLPRLRGRSRLAVAADGHRPALRWVHPRQVERTVRVRLWRALPTRLRFLDAEDDSVVAGILLRLRSPAGDVLWEHEAGLDESVGAEAPSALDLDDAVLEVWSPSHPVVQVPLTALTDDVVRIPRGRLLEVEARDAGARRLSTVLLTARYEPLLLGDRPPGDAFEALEVFVKDRPRLVLPRDRAARVLVTAAHSAPRVLEIEAEASEDAAAGVKPRVVRLEPGAILTARVVDEAGAPLEGARVVVVGSVDGMRVERDGRTTAAGTVQIAALPKAPVEVYAHARGMAWAATVTDLADAKVPVVLTLVAGDALRFVVEDGDGLPLAGVRIHASPEAPAAMGDIVPPDSRPARTTAAGTLVIENLPDRPYQVGLSRPGFVRTSLRDVRPGGGVHFVTLRRRP